MSKKKKSFKKLEAVVKILIATGTFMTGLASLIEALKQEKGRKPFLLVSIAHLQNGMKDKFSLMFILAAWVIYIASDRSIIGALMLMLAAGYLLIDTFANLKE